MQWMVFLLLGCSFSVNAMGVKCHKATISEVEGLRKTEIVFFASWCQQCKPHLLAADAKRSLLVATYDELERAEEVLSHLELAKDFRCVWDESLEIANRYQVRKLPARIHFPL